MNAVVYNSWLWFLACLPSVHATCSTAAMADLAANKGDIKGILLQYTVLLFCIHILVHAEKRYLFRMDPLPPGASSTLTMRQLY